MSAEQITTAIVAGAISGAAASCLTLLYQSAQDRRDRHREHFSRAFQSVTQYEEFPYVVRRRKASERESERIRISSELRVVQADLSYHCTWLMAESGRVGRAYEKLVLELRKIAGGLVHDAWVSDPIDSDAGMNIPDIAPRLAALRPLKESYLCEVRDHLSLWPDSLLRGGRWLRRRVTTEAQQSVD